jgi:hypothetical protein
VDDKNVNDLVHYKINKKITHFHFSVPFPNLPVGKGVPNIDAVIPREDVPHFLISASAARRRFRCDFFDIF